MGKPAFADTILICRKCVRRLGSEGKAIRKRVKRTLKVRKGKIRLEETGCFSLCPKGGQVLAAVRSQGDRRLVIVESTDAVAPALDYLLQPIGKAAKPRAGTPAPATETEPLPDAAVSLPRIRGVS